LYKVTITHEPTYYLTNQLPTYQPQPTCLLTIHLLSTHLPTNLIIQKNIIYDNTASSSRSWKENGTKRYPSAL
jgi:hypothetical protein